MDWISEHTKLLWNSLWGSLFVIVGFLVSKKAILAMLYYLWNLLKMLKAGVRRIFARKSPLKRVVLPQRFWKSLHRFEKALLFSQKREEERFRRVLDGMVKNGRVSSERLREINLYRYFLRFITCHSREEERLTLEALKKELNRTFR